MARTKTGSLRLIDPPPEEMEPTTVELPGEIGPGIHLEDGVLHTEHDDGSTTVDFNPPVLGDQPASKGFYRNLINDLDKDNPGKVEEIASLLMDGIQRDIDSRKEWLETRSRGIQLLGLKLEEPRSDVGTSSAPLEGMATVRHPLLLEATIRFQATARGELLPSGGPVKVRNDTPQKPPKPPQPQQPQAAASPPAPPGMGGAAPTGQQPPVAPPALPPPGANPAQAAAPFATELAVPETEERDSLADALETDFNHYLTVTAPEYVPDTDRMLFYVGFGGDGFKKVFNCPLRRRPVSESVDAEDIIVSNSATALQNCGRVTHRIKMRKSILKRMQILGEYADIDLTPPRPAHTDNPVEKEKQEIAGFNPTAQKPEDIDYTIYECYCELDFDEYAPDHLKGEGLPLPYRVTLEETSRKVLSIVRNWKEDDRECLPKQFLVQFPFIRGLGFYGLGFVHVLGNTTSTLTAMWREMLDGGMFANFPAFVYAKSAGRQLSNQFRAPPGGGIPMDVPAMSRLQDMIMPLPYKEPGASFTAFAQWVEQAGQRLGQTADISIGEGKQDAPVGTTLALIEQATKLLDSVHKRLHWAQNEEFALLKERFREDPEAFWRHNKKPAVHWQKDQFIKALDDHNIVPVADPNNPTSLHRAAKASALEMLASKYPQLLNQQACLERVFRVAGIDSEGLFHPTPLPPPPDPRMVAIQQKAQSTQQATQSQAQTAMAKMQVDLAKLRDGTADRESRERIEAMRLQLEHLKIQESQVVHQREAVGDHISRMADIEADRQKTASELQADVMSKAQELHADAAGRAQDLQIGAVEAHHDLVKERAKHQMDMQHQAEKHQQAMEHQRQMHEAKLEQAKALAAQTKKADTKAGD